MTRTNGVKFNKTQDHALPGKDLNLASRHEVFQIQQGLWHDPHATEADARSVNTIRGLVLDCCQQWNIGHGGE